MKNKLPLKGKYLSAALFAALLLTLIPRCVGDFGGDDTKTTDITLKNGDALKGKYLGNTVIIPPNTEVFLRGKVTFGDKSLLRIGEGATIKGDANMLSWLVIDRGAKIEAIGTAENPITFTSSRPKGERFMKDWGGIILNGWATTNMGEFIGEGDSGVYGSAWDYNDPENNITRDADSSGTLKYVRVFFGGYPFSPNNELNGIGLQGVGSGTTIDYVQTHLSGDDGIEMFGGTVNLRHIVSTANGDDQIDCSMGWRGTIQYAIGCLLPVPGADHTIEYDNNENSDLYSAKPVTEVMHYNMTLISCQYTRSNGIGCRIRRGTQAYFFNSYFASMGQDLLPSESLIFVESYPSKVWFDYNLFEYVLDRGYSDFYYNPEHLNADSSAGMGGEAKPGIFNTAVKSSDILADPNYKLFLDPANFKDLKALEKAGDKAFIPQVNRTQNSAPVTTPPSGAFDPEGAFMGAVRDADHNWLEGWVEFPAN